MVVSSNTKNSHVLYHAIDSEDGYCLWYCLKCYVCLAKLFYYGKTVLCEKLGIGSILFDFWTASE